MSLNNSIFNKFNEICRTCLKGGELLTYLYDEENSINIVKKLITCTTIQFDKNDQMPNKICPTCIEELLQAYNFINKCQISDATLKKYFINQSAIKIEDNPPELIEQQQQQQQEMKIEIEDFQSSHSGNEQPDAINDISIKDEFLEQINLDEMSLNERKRKRDSDDLDYTECTVNLSSKKIATDCDNVLSTADKLNQTFSVQSMAEKSADVSVNHARKTRSECGKENYTKPKAKKNGKNKRFACPVCPKSLMTTVSLLKHFQNHTETKNGNNRKEKSNLTKSLVEQISQQNTSYSCQICKETVKKPINLMNHYSQHISSSKCEYCGKIYKSSQMRKHIRLHHKGLRPFNCEFCPKKFPDFGAKQLHQKQNHSANKSHKCLICFYTFENVDQLYSHHVEHVGADGPYSCANCQGVFNEAHLFIQHKFEQKCGRFYDCVDCFQVFQDVKDRKTHKLNGHQ